MTNNRLINDALSKLDAEADNYIFQTFSTIPQTIRTLLIQRAEEFGINEEQKIILKENGDIFKVLADRNHHLAPFGHGRILFQNNYWHLTVPQRELIFWAIRNEIQIKYTHSVYESHRIIMESKYGKDFNSYPFIADHGHRELFSLIQDEECRWKQYLIERKQEYIDARRDKVIENTIKYVNEKNNIDKFGLNCLSLN